MLAPSGMMVVIVPDEFISQGVEASTMADLHS